MASSLQLSSYSSREDLIYQYFLEGFQYGEIIALLSNRYNINISIRSLQRILKKLNLRRKNVLSNSVADIRSVSNELKGSGSLLGYRSIHQRIKSKGILTDRESVRLCMKILDPEGVDLRKRRKLLRRKYFNKGPNFLWHIDGNDKLKPFGFCIHGAIDGFSRKILWLNISASNKNPAVICDYFIKFVKKINGFPRAIRADRGVENCIVAGLQRFFHRRSSNPVSSFLYGRSTANQRIEAWWSYLKKSCLQYWLSYFKDLRDAGKFDDSNIFHNECLKFCYYGILEDELAQVMHSWNHHRIRKVKNSENFSGVPDYLYYGAASEDIRDYRKNIDDIDLALGEQYAKQPNVFCCSNEFAELALIIIDQENLRMPLNLIEADLLYTNILNVIDSL